MTLSSSVGKGRTVAGLLDGFTDLRSVPSTRQTRELCGTFPLRVEDCISLRRLGVVSSSINFNE